MDMRRLSPTYTVSPQIAASDVQAIADAGFARVICNRPDAENPPQAWSDQIEAAVTAAGMSFVFLPFTHQSLNEDMIAAQREAVDQAEGPVFAYCASGTRCSVIWSLMMAAELGADEILRATGEAGYDLTGLRPQIEMLAAR